MCNFLKLLRNSWLILLTCVASSAVVVSGERVCHLRPGLNECRAFHPGFHHLCFARCQILHSGWPRVCDSHRLMLTHTLTKDRRDWKEKDKKMRDSRRRVNGGRTSCPGAHAAVQSTHPSCFMLPGKPNTLRPCHLVASYRISSCFLMTQSQKNLIQDSKNQPNAQNMQLQVIWGNV